MKVYIFIGILVGIIAETLAYLLGLWVYRNKAFRLGNIALVFGLLAGSLTYQALKSNSLTHAAAAMGVFGLLYEVTNLHLAHLWRFEGKTFAWFKSYAAVAATTVAWASVPAVIAGLGFALGKMLPTDRQPKHT